MKVLLFILFAQGVQPVAVLLPKEVKSTASRWRFVESYPGVGAALVDGPAIVAIKDASQELIDSCPEAVEWLKGKF